MASSRTAKEMSGRVQFDRYMHLPTIAQYGSVDDCWRSSSVVGHIEVVSRKEGQGVLTELQFSMWKSDSIRVVYCSWSIMSIRRSLHLRMRQPRSHLVSPSSVIGNLCFICDVARSDSDLELDARSRSSTLLAEMVSVDGDLRMYMLQSDWHRV